MLSTCVHKITNSLLTLSSFQTRSNFLPDPAGGHHFSTTAWHRNSSSNNYHSNT